MFKKALSILSILYLLTSCSSKLKSALDALPKWVLDPYVKGTIAAVGMAPKSAGGLQFQIPKAEADARANIAAQIETEVSRLTKNALREAKVGEQNDVENVFSQATKNLVKKVPLSGARRINMFKDPTDGTMYIHMSIDSEMVAAYIKKNEDLLASAIASANITRANLDKAQEAVKGLFNDLDKELGQE